MNRQGVTCPPQDADSNLLVPWTLDLAELYSLLPQEFHDTSFQPSKQKVYYCFLLFKWRMCSRFLGSIVCDENISDGRIITTRLLGIMLWYMMVLIL